MSDSDSSLGHVPLPLSPPPDDDDEYNMRSTSISPGRIPIPDAPHPLDDIPIPVNTGNKDLQDEIPLPPDCPDSSKYSPSQTVRDDDEMNTSPGQCELVSSTATKLSVGENNLGALADIVTSSSPSSRGINVTDSSKPVTKQVLDRAQAKKRLMAFSAAKLQTVSSTAPSSTASPTKKGLVLKGVSVFNPKEKRQPSADSKLNIETIREEDTKIKEIIAVNKILSEKLKQVNSITNNIPKSAGTMTAVVNPFSTTDQPEPQEPPPISEPTVSASASSPSRTTMKPPSTVSRHLRKRSMSKSPSPGPVQPQIRSRSRERGRDRDYRGGGSSRRSKDRDRGHDDKRSGHKRDVDRDRDRDKDKRRSRSPAPYKSRSRKSKSPIPIASAKVPRSKSPLVINIRRSSASPPPKSKSDKRHGREKSESPKKSKTNPGGRRGSKSPSKDMERRTIRKFSKSKSKSPIMIPVVHDKYIVHEYNKRASISTSPRRSKSKSPKRSSRKSRSKSRSPKLKSKKESRKKSKRSRSRDKEEKRRKDESKERRREAERLEAERRALEKELDKVRQNRMPVDWTEYFKFQFTAEHIQELHLRAYDKRVGDRKGSSSRSTSRSPNRSAEASDFSKALEKPLKLPINRNTIDLSTGREYPFFLAQKTKTQPSLSYGVNPYSFAGYYITRKDILKIEYPEICQAMNEICKAIPATTSSKREAQTTKAKTQQDWYAVNEQTFCPAEGKRGVTMSHLFSDDEIDSSSTTPTPTATSPSSHRNVSSLRKSSPPETKKSEESEPEHDSLDSAPSPLLKKRYKESPVKPKVVDSSSKKTLEGRRKRSSTPDSDNSAKIIPRDKLEKKADRGIKPKSPESEETFEMDTEDFPLEKEPVVVIPVKSIDAEKSISLKIKEKKVKRQKKKRKKKNKKHSTSDESSDDELETFKKIDKGKVVDKEKEKSSKRRKRLKTDKKRKHSDESETGGNTSSSVVEIEVQEETKHQKKKPKIIATEVRGPEKDKDKKVEEKPPMLSEKVEKDDGARKKKTKHEESRSKSKHGKRKHTKKKGRSPSSSSESSDSEDDSDSESSESSSEFNSSNSDTVRAPKDKKRRSLKKQQKRDKHKLEKKTKKRSKSSTSASETETEKSSKQRKGKKEPDQEDKGNDKRSKRRDGDGGGSGDKDRGGGGGVGGGGGGGSGAGGSGFGGERGDRSRDHGRERDRKRDSGHDRRSRDSGSRRYEDRGRRRDGGFDEQVEPFDWENDMDHIHSDPPIVQFETKVKVDPHQQRTPETIVTHTILSQLDDDLLLRSVFKNESLSAEALLKNLSQVEFETFKSDDRFSVTTSGIGSSNWSDDSEDETTTTTPSTSMRNDVKPKPEPENANPSFASILSEDLSFNLSVSGLLKKVGEPISVYDSIVEASSATTGPLLLISHDSSSTDSDSDSDSDSSDSSSTSTSNSNSSDCKDEKPIDTPGNSSYDPFEDVMSQIAAEKISTDEVLTKVTQQGEFNKPITPTSSASSKEEPAIINSTNPTVTIINRRSQNTELAPLSQVKPNMEHSRGTFDPLKDRRSRDNSREGRLRHRCSPSSRIEKDRYHHRHRHHDRIDDRDRDRYDDRDRDRYERYRRSLRHHRSRSYSRSRSRSGSRSPISRSPSPRSSNSRYHKHREDRRYSDFREDREGRRYPDLENEKDWGEDRKNRVLRDRERYYSNEPGSGYDSRDRHHFKDRRGQRDWHNYPEDYRYEQDGHSRGPDGQEQYTSPPLQSNVADSTISDAELAANNQMGLMMPQYPSEHYEGNKNYPPVFQYPMPFPPPPMLHHGDGEFPADFDMMGDIMSGIPPAYGDSSPPRRLSLDERLEREMGIKLDVPKKMQYNTQGPYYHGSQFQPGGGQQYPPHHQSQLLDPAFAIPPYWSDPKPQQAPAEMASSLSVHQQRQQCQIVQKGNVLQVMPTAIPNGSFTIHARVEVTSNSGDEMGVVGATSAKRVVIIKVPVVPFAMPVAVHQDVATTHRLKRKRKHDKHHKKNKTVTEEKTEKSINKSDKMDTDMSSTTEIMAIKELPSENDAMSEKLHQLQEKDVAVSLNVGDESNVGLSESNAESGSSSPGVAQIMPRDDPGIDERKDESIDKSPTAELELDGEQDETITNDQAQSPPEDEQELKTPEQNLFDVKFPLPEAGKGILVSVGFRDKVADEPKRTKKGVKFADGVNPGYGTESSEGEEMRSPPPPSILEMEKLKLKKLKKKRDRAKRKLQLKEKEAAKLDLTAVPPPPNTPFPFCHPGILYQVCPQYAVLYAQALAEKGFEIVFEGTHQIDQLTGSVPIIPDECSADNIDCVSQQFHEPLMNTPPQLAAVVEQRNQMNTIDASITLDVQYQPITHQSSNLIQITDSYEPPCYEPTPESFFDVQFQESPRHECTPPNILPPNLSSPVKMYSTTPIPSTPPQKMTNSPKQHFTLPRQLTTPPRKSSKATPEGSPIPILIRRTRSPPPHVFPSALAETDLEGNALN